MLIRAFSKLVVFVGPLIIIWYMVFVYFDGETYVEKWSEDYMHRGQGASSRPSAPGDSPRPSIHEGNEPDGVTFDPPADSAPPPAPDALFPAPFPVDANGEAIVNYFVFRELFSASTPDGKYFNISFGDDYPVINPNILPHPTETGAWLVVAQRQKNGDPLFEELVCTAKFQPDGSLACTSPPTALPVAPTTTDRCEGDMAYFAHSAGPHDMRVFHGPTAPYAVYGSQSGYACFGLFAHDFRSLVPFYGSPSLGDPALFPAATELQRPPPWHPVEKNWFLFWDVEGKAYVHHDVAPARVFAEVRADGSVGPDLAPQTALADNACMTRYLPSLGLPHESLHQATNALSLTLCARSDPSCTPTPANTFILSLVQRKSFPAFHGVYDPYVVLFASTPPFALYAISTKPLWMHGRAALTPQNAGRKWREAGSDPPRDQAEMVYVTSVGWRGGGWHGYVDDGLMLGFGIEDERAGGMDVLAGDLVRDLGVCGQTV